MNEAVYCVAVLGGTMGTVVVKLVVASRVEMSRNLSGSTRLDGRVL